MTGNLKSLAVLCAFLLMSGVQAAIGADIQITSTVRPTKLSINDRLTITVTITGSDARKAGQPVLKKMPDFTIIGRPSTTTSYHFINGVTTHLKSYTYTVIPNRTGTFLIGGIAVSDGKYFYSAPGTKVEVTGKQSPRSSIIPQKSNPNIFIRTFVDNEQPYVGEQITLTFELYNRLTLWGDTEYEPPSTTGFWTVALPKIPPVTKIIDGRIFQYSAIKIALFPTTSGELTIGPASLDYDTGGFFSSQRSENLYSKPITINVKPLPEEGKPANFTGAVGNFDIAVSADKTSLKVGDIVSAVVIVSGRGNLDIISSVDAPDLSSFKTYDPKVSDTLKNSGFVVGGGKTWEYILMPRFQGNIIIEPFSLSFFDPEDKSYHMVLTQEIKLKVMPGEPVSSDQIAGIDQRNSIKKIADDINFIKPDKSILKNSNRQMYSNKFFYLVYILPFTFFSAALAVKKRHDTIERNTGLKRRLKAWKRAQKRMDEAVRLQDKGERVVFYGRLNETITDFIGDRLNIDTGALTTTGLNETLMESGVEPDLADLTAKTLELCDFFRFSSSGSGQEMQDKLLNDTSDILNRLRDRL